MTIACPFCSEPEFDLPGLKAHISRRQCDVFEKVEDLWPSLFSAGPMLEVNPTRSLTLPYPISANAFWRTTYAKKMERCIVYETPEAGRWKEEAGWLAKAAGIRQPIIGPVALRIVHHHRAIVQDGKLAGNRNGSVFDLDNVLKVSIDALKKVVYVDDKQVKKIVAEYGDPTEKGKLVIGIEELPEVQPSLFPKPEKKDTGGLPF